MIWRWALVTSLRWTIFLRCRQSSANWMRLIYVNLLSVSAESLKLRWWEGTSVPSCFPTFCHLFKWSLDWIGCSEKLATRWSQFIKKAARDLMKASWLYGLWLAGCDLEMHREKLDAGIFYIILYDVPLQYLVSRVLEFLVLMKKLKH